VRSSASSSNTHPIVCPLCEVGELHTFGGDSARCGSCGCLLGEEILETLREIVGSPDALGNHACECGHPEMRRLPDGVFHCPACGSEVLPIEDSGFLRKPADRSGACCAAYRSQHESLNLESRLPDATEDDVPLVP
jgi:ribosomal protein L37AE/L43A